MLEMFSDPQSVAVIGASRDERKLGYGVLSNIIKYGYQGRVYPINPKTDEILGLRCYPSVLDVPDPIDLAVIVIPSKYVAASLEECGQKGLKGAIIITAGFREVGGEGAKMERELIAIAQRYGMRLVGPNCLGVIDTVAKLNASFAAGMAHPGSIAFMSQSGAVCIAVLDMSMGEQVGFSRFVSLGNKANLNEVDFIETWRDDPHSKVIIAYLEGIADGARFIKVAREVTKHKPIIAIKSGTTSAGSRAVSSHTGTLAGSERAYEAAFTQTGIIRADSVQELFDYSIAFARQPLLPSSRIAIVTNAGGPGIMAADACERAGLQLASLERETLDTLKKGLPPEASALNPVDVLGDAWPDRYGLALEAVLKDANVGGVIAIVVPQVMTKAAEIAKVIGDLSTRYPKTILGCFMGEPNVAAGIEVLQEYRVPNYPIPERAVGAMAAMMRYSQWLKVPPLEIEKFDLDGETIRGVFEHVRADGRLTIGDAEAREVMKACSIPVPASALASSPDEAVAYAEEMGYPVVMKIASPDILHKSDVGGVKLNVGDANAVRDTFDLLTYRATRYMPDAQIWGCQIQQMVRGRHEVIIGMNRDPQFGPLMMFGLGGIYVEALRDVTFRIAPLCQREAEEMINEIRAASLLRGVRGEPPADIAAIVDTLLRASQLVTEFPEIVEMDINPLIVREAGQGSVGIDMRLVLSS